MRTLKKLLSLLALLAPFAATAQGLSEEMKKNLHSNEDECYALMKFNFPTKTVVKELDWFSVDLGWKPYIVRRFFYADAHCESGGNVEAKSKDGRDFGIIGLHEDTGMFDEYCQILRRKHLPVPSFSERDMANSANGYLITCMTPMRVLNTVARKYKWGYQWRITSDMWSRYNAMPDGPAKQKRLEELEERALYAMEDIIRRWNGGPKGNTPEKRPLTEIHWQRFLYSYKYCISALEEEGFACGYGPIPGKVLRPKNWKD